MRKRIVRGTRIAEVLLTAGCLVLSGPVIGLLSGAETVFADGEKGTVQVILENSTWSKDDGAAWEGKIVADVELKDGFTGLDALKEAAAANNMEVVSMESSYGGYYISDIGGVAEKGAADYAGWLYTFNTGAAMSSIDTYKVEDGSLSDGDIIHFLYSTDGGYDLGFYDGKNESAGVAELEVEGGTLSAAYSKDAKEYTLTVSKDTETVKVFPKAAMGDEELFIESNEESYKRGAAIPVSEGQKIIVRTVKTNYDENWNPVTAEATVTLTVALEQEAPDSEAVYEDLLSVIDASFAGDSITYGSEWYLMDLARAGKLSEEKKAAYLEAVKAGISEKAESTLKGQNPTESARLILALTSVEADPTDVGGVNLLEGISSMEDIKTQGVNAAAFALLALDSNKYEPVSAEGKTPATRDALIDYIASCELANGGFDYTGAAETADPDMTAMVLYALAPYNTENAKATQIIDRCVDILSKAQSESGSFVSWGNANSNSTAQVITALAALGIDAGKDERFIKNGKNAVDAMNSFYHMGEGGYYTADSANADFYSNYQMAMALNALNRLRKGEPSFYNMVKSNLGGQGATGTSVVPFVMVLIALAGSAATAFAAGKKRA